MSEQEIIEVGKALLSYLRNDLTAVELGKAAHDAVAALNRTRSGTVAIPRTRLKALAAAVRAAKRMRDDLSALELHGDGAHDDSCSICRAIEDFDAAFRDAGIQDRTND